MRGSPVRGRQLIFLATVIFLGLVGFFLLKTPARATFRFAAPYLHPETAPHPDTPPPPPKKSPPLLGNDDNNNNNNDHKSRPEDDARVIVTLPPEGVRATRPGPLPEGGPQHPIWHLARSAEREFAAVTARQSRTLAEAAREYRRRYGLAPPPRFDRWWAFAQRRGVRLVDEFDAVRGLLAPFWGLRPATVRARAREAIAEVGNGVLGVQIRGGKVARVVRDYDGEEAEGEQGEDGPGWMAEALVGMLEGFVEWLPDMDLAFNTLDEPRVVVAGEDMARLVARGMAKAAELGRRGGDGARNDFSPRPADVRLLGAPARLGARADGVPPGSPARASLEDDDALYDDVAAYAAGPLGFVRNRTAMTDVCLSPSLRDRHGFFQGPNAYGAVHELFPIFSQSKLSAYADILYPSPWYWADKVPYNESADRGWEDKEDGLYWRGSTTGGYSSRGAWRRHHRQRLVQRLNAPDEAAILLPPGSDGDEPVSSSLSSSLSSSSSPNRPQDGQWTPRQVPRRRYARLFNVSFSHVGQCAPADCDTQAAVLPMAPYAPQEAALGHKHVLDVDGNAFSGRFYALLRSRSLVYKWAVFREWHDEWLRPWVHYVPLSLLGGEWLEAVRYFAEGVGGQEKDQGDGGGREPDMKGKGKDKKKGRGLNFWFSSWSSSSSGSSSGSGSPSDDPSYSPLGGPKVAERLAMQGREWAGKALRNEDLEAWFFRLLLEYARVIDDDRDNIGYLG
ncbi:hypothetical protein VTJ83DRAFT_1189 [Remersonia thermophila]|uniref:Glycosyl transferase CAP10 domain-containing protein n=1 Tax=Remersonia thermophila TaxID=72144 RepID=A0ABR4DNI0_9PEZI